MEPNHHVLNRNHPKETSPLLNILTSSEGHIFLTGISLGLLYTIWLASWVPEKSHVFAAMTVTHFLFGRAAGMSFGYTMKLSYSVVIIINLIIETIILLLFYPLFVFSWRHLLVIRSLRNMMDGLHKAAERNRHFIRKYGLFGLFFFVWLPFWMTGSLVGCVIGFLLDLHPWLNVGVVLAGSYVAIASWAILLQEVHIQVEEFSPYASITILVVIILIVLGGHLAHKRRSDKDSSEEEHTNKSD